MDHIKGNGFDIEWSGKEFEDHMVEVMKGRIAAAGEELKALCKKNVSTPVFPRSSPGEFPHLETGDFQDSIFSVSERDGLSAVVGCYPVEKSGSKGSYTIPYGGYLEFGITRGVTIYAAPGSLMKWIDEKTGQWRSAKQVTMGPLQARPWLKPSFESYLETFAQRMGAPLDASEEFRGE